MSEYRAVYLGMFGTLGVATLAPAGRVREPLLGDVICAAVVAEADARLIGIVVAEPTGRGWVERAGEVSVRRLTDEVEWALTVRDGLTPISPPPPGASLEIYEQQMGARPAWEFPDAEISFVATPSVLALLRTAILAFAHPRDSLVGGLEALLLHVKAEWEDQPGHRDPIFARDGWRCAVPVCTARRNLHDHHLTSARAVGGTSARTASRSAPGTICAAFTPGACARKATNRTRSPGRSACARGRDRSFG